MAIHLLWVGQKTVDIALSLDLLQDPFVVVVAKRTAKFVVAHVRLILMMTPPDGNSLRLKHSELSFSDVGGPFDNIAVFLPWVSKQGIQKLPELNASFSCTEQKVQYAIKYFC